MAVSLRQLKEDVGLPYEEKSTEPIIETQEQQNTGVSLSKMKADAGISIPKAVMPENTYSDFSSVFGKLNNNYKPKLAGCVDYVFNTIKKNGGATDFINAGNTWNDFIKRGTRITPNDISKVPDGAVVGFLNTSSGNNHMAIVYTDSNGVKRLNESLSRYSQGKAWLANNRTLASQVAKDETLMFMPKYNSNTLGHYKAITPVKKTQAPDISNVIDSEKFTNVLSRLYTQGIGHKQAADIILKANPELAKYKDSIYKKANEIEYTHNQNVAAAETKKVRGMKNEFSNFFGFTPTNNPVNTRFKHQNTIDEFNTIASEAISNSKLYSNYFDIKNKSFAEWDSKDKNNFKKLFNDIEKKVNAKGIKWNKEAIYTGLKDFINTGTAIDVKGTQKPTYTEASEKFSVGKALQTGGVSVVSSAIGSVDNMVNLFGVGANNQAKYEEWLSSKNIKTDDISKRFANIGFAIAPIPISKGRIGFDIIKNGKTILAGLKDINKAKAILVNLANMAKELNVAKTAVAAGKLAGTVYASGTAGQVARDAADVVTDNVDKLGIYNPEDFNPVARTLVQIKNAAIKGAVTLSAQQALKDRKLSEYIAKSDIAQKIIISDEFNKFVSAPFTKGALTEFIKDPIGITASVVVQSLAMYAPALIEGRALGSVFGRVGLGAGIGKGSYELEYASKVIGVMQDAGVDITNEKSLRSAFANPGLFAKAHKLARRRGLTVAMFDILSVGLAGRLWGRAGESMASKVLTGLAEVTIQGLFGAGGEMAGAIVTGEDIVAGAVLSEYLGEIGTGGVEVATAVKQSQHSQIEQHLKTIGSGDITPENINIVDAIVFAKNPTIAKDIGASPDIINNLNIEPNEEEYNKFYLDNIGKTANEQSKIFKELSGIENKIASGRYSNDDVERYKILVSFADNVTPSPQIAEEDITEDNPDILDAEEQDLISRQLDTKIDRDIIVQQWADAKGVENQDIENEIDSKTDQTESTDIDTTPEIANIEEESTFDEQVTDDTELNDIASEEAPEIIEDNTPTDEVQETTPAPDIVITENLKNNTSIVSTELTTQQFSTLLKKRHLIFPEYRLYAIEDRPAVGVTGYIPQYRLAMRVNGKLYIQPDVVDKLSKPSLELVENANIEEQEYWNKAIGNGKTPDAVYKPLIQKTEQQKLSDGAHAKIKNIIASSNLKLDTKLKELIDRDYITDEQLSIIDDLVSKDNELQNNGEIVENPVSKNIDAVLQIFDDIKGANRRNEIDETELSNKYYVDMISNVFADNEFKESRKFNYRFIPYSTVERVMTGGKYEYTEVTQPVASEQVAETSQEQAPKKQVKPAPVTDINKLPPKKQLEQLVKDNTITKTQSAAIKELIMDDEESNRSGEPVPYSVAKHLNPVTKLLIKLSKAESENNIKMSQDDYSNIISSVFSNKTFKGKLTEKQINNIVDASVKAVKKSVRIDPKEYIKSEFENNDIISGMPQETIDKIRKALTNASRASKADTPLVERVYNKLNGIGQKTKKTVEDIQAQQAERDIQNTDIDVTVDENNTIDTALEKLDATDVPNDNITMEQIEAISDIIENSKELNKDIEDNGHFNVYDIMHMDLTQEEMKIRARMPNKNIDKADVVPNRIVNDATRHNEVLASNPSDYLASYYDLCVDIVKLTNMKFSRMYGRNDYPAHVLERTFLAEVKPKFRNNQYVIAHEFGHAKAIEMGIQPRENIDLSEPNTGNGLTVEEVAEILPFSDNTTEKGRFSSYTEEKFKDADEAEALRYQISEGIAEIMRNFLLTPEIVEEDAPLMYDRLTKWFSQEKQSKQITQIRNKAGGYNRARLLDRAQLRDKISKTTGTEKFFNILKYIAKGHFIDKTTTEFVDALAPMRFVQEILTGKNNSQYISERNGYDLARLSRGSEAIVNVELNKLYTILANTGDKTVGTGDWVTYLRTKHIENLLKAEAYESDLTIDDTTEIISELDANYPNFAQSAEDYMDWWRSFVAVYEKDFMSPTLYRRATINYNAEINKLQNKQPATEQEKADIEKEIARLEKERLSNEYYVPLNVLLEPFIGGESFAQGQGSGVNASFVNQRKAYMHRRGNQTFPYLNWVELIANRVATSTKKHMMNNAAQAFFEQMGDKEKSGLFFKEQTQLYTVEHIRDILIRHLAENKPDVHGVYEKYIAYLAVNQRKTSSTETQASFIKHIQGGAYDANTEARNTMALSFMQNSGVIEDIINNEEINIFNRAKALTKDMINNNIVMIMKNGQPKFYSVLDKELYDALTNMEQDKRWKGIQRWAGLVSGARIVREFVTLYPLFSFNNSFRDGLTLASMSRGKYIPGVSFFEGFAHIHNKDEWYNNFIKYGAGLSTPSTEGEAKLLTLNSKNKNVILKTIQGAFDLRDTAENANRVANFQVTYNALREMGYSEEAAYTKSAFESRDVLDWAMRGKSEWFNTLLSAVAFSRSFINGNAKLLSMVAKGDNATRQKILLYNFVIGTIPALLETLKYKDDDEYKNMGKYIKDHYYLIKLRKGVWLRLPIPFELGLTFNAYPKRIFNATIGKDENAMKEWFKLLQTYMLSFVPNTAQIVYNLAVNKDDYTGNAIVGYYQAGGTSQLLPEYQKKKNTSLTTVELAEWVNPEVPLSPAKTEYFIKQIAPYFGELALATTDALLSKIIDGQEEEKQSRNNVLKTVLVKDNVYSDWYDSFLKLHTEIKRTYNSMKTKTDEKEQNEVAKNYGYKDADTLKKAWQAVHNTELLFNGKLPVTEEEIGTGVIKRKYIETITPDGRTKRNTVYQDSPITKYFESYNNVDKRTAYKSEVADLSKYTIKEVERLIKGEN